MSVEPYGRRYCAVLECHAFDKLYSGRIADFGDCHNDLKDCSDVLSRRNGISVCKKDCAATGMLSAVFFESY